MSSPIAHLLLLVYAYIPLSALQYLQHCQSQGFLQGLAPVIGYVSLYILLVCLGPYYKLYGFVLIFTSPAGVTFVTGSMTGPAPGPCDNRITIPNPPQMQAGSRTLSAQAVISIRASQSVHR
jgi:hypothetical protein